MIVIIHSPAGSPSIQDAVKLAREKTADIVLKGEAVFLGRKKALGDFCGAVYAVREDVEKYNAEGLDKAVKLIDEARLPELAEEEGGVLAEFRTPGVIE